MATRMRLADLIGSRVVAADGTGLGHVVDLVVSRDDGYRVIALDVGAMAWLDRLDMTKATSAFGPWRGRRQIPWEHVDRFERLTIHLKPHASHTGIGAVDDQSSPRPSFRAKR